MITKLVWKAKEVIDKVNRRLERNLDKVGVLLQRDIVMSFGSGGTPGSGGTKGRVHSKPGEPPYVQTGNLRRSITFQREGHSKLLVGSTLQPEGSTPSYAWLLEMGSPGGQLSARPYLRPALRKNKGLIKRMLMED